MNCCAQNAEYEVIDDSQEHWWKVKDQHGTVGYIPSNYVKAKELLGLDKYEYVVNVSLSFICWSNVSPPLRFPQMVRR